MPRLTRAGHISPQTFKEVFLEDCDNVDVGAIMFPPRIIGFGQACPNVSVLESDKSMKELARARI